MNLKSGTMSFWDGCSKITRSSSGLFLDFGTGAGQFCRDIRSGGGNAS